jgi:ATP-binding cassette, subfamily B, bacterial
MISAAYGKNISLQKLRDLSYLSKEGVSLAGLYQASESIGFRTMVVKLQTTADVQHYPALHIGIRSIL